MTALASALYTGLVTHRRHGPHRHFLRYRVFMLLADLDELPAMAAKSRLFAHNRPALLSLHDADHGDRSGAPLRPQVEAHLAAAGIEAGGPIRLLCMPRVLGYGFNPLSLYFCHGRDGRLAAILYEVTNTFGDRHSYLMPVEGDGPVHQACVKRLYVSPFLGMDLSYAFRIVPPGETLGVHIEASRGGESVLGASFVGKRRTLGDAALLAAWIGHPLLTLKVMAGIHWEALRLWLKGARFHHRPTAPAEPVTVVRTLNRSTKLN